MAEKTECVTALSLGSSEEELFKDVFLCFFSCLLSLSLSLSLELRETSLDLKLRSVSEFEILELHTFRLNIDRLAEHRI